MTLGRLSRVLFFCAAACMVAITGMRVWLTPREIPEADRVTAVTTWKAGKIAKREIVQGAATPRVTAEDGNGITTVREIAIGEGPLFRTRTLMAAEIVAGRDGVKAVLADKIAYVTPDDLASAQAYDHAQAWAEAGFSFGTDPSIVFALLADRLHTTAMEVERYATLTRVRFEKAPPPTPEPVTQERVVDAVTAGARYLARSTDDQGRFRYLVDAFADRTLSGYNWPRHAGAVFFLAQAASLTHDPQITYATLRAAAFLREREIARCGPHRCVGDADGVDLGSTALAVIALTEIVKDDIDTTYAPLVADLADFLRSQQRADGEFMHEYDLTAQRPIDVQRLYYSGEATLALARAARITNRAADLEAASRGLANLVHGAWSFFGDRYYFGEEHWTCQAVAELWDRAPNEEALDFCLRWLTYQRAIQYVGGDSAYDSTGAFGVGYFVTPRTTPASSRGEAAGATLYALSRARPSDTSNIEMLHAELTDAIGFVLRYQLARNAPSAPPEYLFANPDAIRGAIPGSPFDLTIRIDYIQHAGSMMMRWLSLQAQSPPAH